MKYIERYLFYLLLFSIPFQTRIILWQQSWYFNEWQAISIYGTDILLVILVLFWLFRGAKPTEFLGSLKQGQETTPSKVARYDYFLFAFVAISALSIKSSSNIYISAWSVLKLIEFVIFYFYIKSYAINAFGFIPSLLALISGALFQSVVAILQFFQQSDLGLRIFGESLLGKDMTGIASFFNLHGEKIIRAYGTTPHPNVLAAYLFLGVYAFYFVYLYTYLYQKSRINHPALNWFLLAAYPVMLLGLFFTFARTVVFLWFAGFCIRAGFVLGKKEFRKIFSTPANKAKLTKILVISTVVVVLFGTVFWSEAVSRIKISGDEEAVQLRIFYGRESLKTGVNWLGVGSGNFVNWLMLEDPDIPRYLYQPVHNIYLLTYAETGMLGVLAFVLFFVFMIRDFVLKTAFEKFYHYSFLLVLLSFLTIGLFDHFLLTLQQGRFMFWLVAALLTKPVLDGINSS